MHNPPFTLASLVIIVLVCAYFGAREATKRLGCTHPVWEQGSPFPFVIWQDEMEQTANGSTFPRRYFLWLFGRMLKLPYETEWAPPMVSECPRK